MITSPILSHGINLLKPRICKIGNVLKHIKTKPVTLKFSAKIFSIVKANNYILLLYNPSIESCQIFWRISTAKLLPTSKNFDFFAFHYFNLSPPANILYVNEIK